MCALGLYSSLSAGALSQPGPAFSAPTWDQSAEWGHNCGVKWPLSIMCPVPSRHQPLGGGGWDGAVLKEEGDPPPTSGPVQWRGGSFKGPEAWASSAPFARAQLAPSTPRMQTPLNFKAVPFGFVCAGFGTFS